MWISYKGFDFVSQRTPNNARLQVLTAFLMWIQRFWNVWPVRLANIYQHSEDRNASIFRVKQSKELIKRRKNLVSATQFILQSTLKNTSKMLLHFVLLSSG
jgi:hypothetical protein